MTSWRLHKSRCFQALCHGTLVKNIKKRKKFNEEHISKVAQKDWAKVEKLLDICSSTLALSNKCPPCLSVPLADELFVNRCPTVAQPFTALHALQIRDISPPTIYRPFSTLKFPILAFTNSTTANNRPRNCATWIEFWIRSNTR